MSTAEGIVRQRDRFLAFSFASADLFMEIAPDGRIGFVSGAIKKMTGTDEEGVRGRLWAGLFAEKDGDVLKALVDNMIPGRRCGPLLVGLKNAGGKEDMPVLFTAIRMPQKDAVYITLAVPNAAMKRYGADNLARESANPLLHKDEFIKTTQKVIKDAIKSGRQVDLTLLELPDLQEMKDRISPDKWEEMRTLMTDLIKSQAIDSETVAQLADNRYSLLRDKNAGIGGLQEQISSLLKGMDPAMPDTRVKSVSVDASLDRLNDKEGARALLYTLNAFERQGAAAKISDMREGFSSFLRENTEKVQAFKKIIADRDFSFNFQPIVHLEDLSISHYEILTRFRDGGSPYDLITFGEAVGLAMDFDLAVCAKAIDYMAKLPKDLKENKFTLNVSGQSVENDQFVSDLRRLLDLHKGLSGLLTFEITESAGIQNLEKVNNVIGLLQGDGFGVCLDDFGAGSASYQYLQKLQVDFIKLDGAYVQHIFDTPKDQMMVRHLAQLCADLGIGMVAEHIETADEAVLLKSMNVGFGQGYWFSRPLASLDYQVDGGKLAAINAS